MANNLIQIKRSLVTATPPSLANGELAYTANGDILFIGSNGAVVPVGGKRVPGTLTANQALVANSTSGIDKVIVANLVPTVVWANGAGGTAGQVLASNSSGGVYWTTPTSGVAGTNSQVQFNNNGTLAGDAGLTYNATTDELTVANNILVGSTVNAASYTVGSSFIANSTGAFATGTVNASVLSIGGWVIANNSGVFTSGVVNGNIVQVGTKFVANTTQVTIANDVGLSANGSKGTAGQVLTSNGTTVYWTTPTNGDITSVTAGNGLSGGGLSGDVTLDVGSGNGISVSADAIAVNGGSTLTVNTSGAHVNSTLSITSLTTSGDVTVNGNTKLGDATTDVVSFVGYVNTSILPSSNVTYNLGTNGQRWNELHASNVHSTTGYFDGSVSIGGDLTVSGSVVSVNVATLAVTDSLIQLAKDNTTSDLLDIGFYGNYNADGGTHEHTGIFRDASDDTYKLFKGLQDAPTTTVNTAGVGYAIATLQAYLISGGLSTNSTSANLVANSSYAVSIVANTITLSSPLAGNSGGTGLASYTAEDILVANSTNGFRKLSLGTTGYVLQSNGTAIVYDTLDGGTF